MRQRGKTAIQARFSFQGKRHERTFSSGRTLQDNLKTAMRWQAAQKEELKLRSSRDHGSVKFCGMTLESGLRLLDLHYRAEKKTSYQGYIAFLLQNPEQFPLLRIPLEDLQRSDITKFRKDMQAPYTVPAGQAFLRGRARVKGKRPLREKTRSRATVNKYINLLSVVIDHLNEEHDADFENVVKTVRKLKGADRKRKHRVTDDEFAAILSHIPAQDASDIVEFFTFSLNQGTRRQETFNLTWGDVDPANYRLTLPHHKTEAHDDEEGGQIRTLTRTACEQIQRLRQHYKAIHGRAPDPEARIFTRYQTEATYSKIFARAAREAGLQDIRLHDLRHEATTRIARDCRYNSTLTKSYTGHKDERSLARYSHASPRDIHDTVQQLQVQNGRDGQAAQQGSSPPSDTAVLEADQKEQTALANLIERIRNDKKSKSLLVNFFTFLSDSLCF